jgi:hypothetical protein
VNLHAAAFIASATRLGLMLQDLSHLNSESRDWKDEFAVLDYHRRMAFQAKNCLREAEQTLKDLPKDTP